MSLRGEERPRWDVPTIHVDKRKTRRPLLQSSFVIVLTSLLGGMGFVFNEALVVSLFSGQKLTK